MPCPRTPSLQSCDEFLLYCPIGSLLLSNPREPRHGIWEKATWKDFIQFRLVWQPLLFITCYTESKLSEFLMEGDTEKQCTLHFTCSYCALLTPSFTMISTTLTTQSHKIIKSLQKIKKKTKNVSFPKALIPPQTEFQCFSMYIKIFFMVQSLGRHCLHLLHTYL